MKLTTFLTIGTCVGAPVIAFLAVKDSRKAVKTYERELPDVDPYTIPLKEKAKMAWKDYIPTGIAIGATMACSIASHKLSVKTIAALGASLASARALYAKYGEKIEEFLDSDKAKKLKDAVVKEHAEEQLKKVDLSKIKYKGKKNKINDEFAYFYEPISDQYIFTTERYIIEAVDWANEQLNTKGYFEINDYMNTIGGYLIDDSWADKIVVANGDIAGAATEDCDGWFGIKKLNLRGIEPMKSHSLATDRNVYMINLDMIFDDDYVPTPEEEEMQHKIESELDPHFEEILDPPVKDENEKVSEKSKKK